MDINTDAVDEVVLALNLCGENRAWNSLDWDALNRLHEKGFIGDPVNRAKSVWLTDEGLGDAERLFTKYLACDQDTPLWRGGRDSQKIRHISAKPLI